MEERRHLCRHSRNGTAGLWRVASAIWLCGVTRPKKKMHVFFMWRSVDPWITSMDGLELGEGGHGPSPGKRLTPSDSSGASWRCAEWPLHAQANKDTAYRSYFIPGSAPAGTSIKIENQEIAVVVARARGPGGMGPRRGCT
jgi:hypothetical protein